jgi:hypothetical protein
MPKEADPQLPVEFAQIEFAELYAYLSHIERYVSDNHAEMHYHPLHAPNHFPLLTSIRKARMYAGDCLRVAVLGQGAMSETQKRFITADYCSTLDDEHYDLFVKQFANKGLKGRIYTLKTIMREQFNHTADLVCGISVVTLHEKLRFADGKPTLVYVKNKHNLALDIFLIGLLQHLKEADMELGQTLGKIAE